MDPVQPRRRPIRLLWITVFVLGSLLPASTWAHTAMRPVAAAPAAPSACPAGPADLPETVERAKFCVYYTHDSITDEQAEFAADTVEEYWNRFVALGFNEPKYSGKLQVQLLDIPGSCNGATGWSANYITTYAGCFDPAEAPTYESARKVLGHELTHRVQYNYDTGPGAPIQTKMLKEGTARATEDNWFLNIDNWPNALSAVSSSFNKQVNTYLMSTNADITSVPMRYNSALWWKYASEQFGTTVVEPERGIDFFEELYSANTAGASGIAAINQALAAKGAGMNFNAAFERFAVANWTKDLAGAPGGSYNYIDEDEPGNPGSYGPVIPTNGGAIQIGAPAIFNDQPISRYGIRYFQASVGANCPVVTAAFRQDAAPLGPAFYHVVTQKPGAPEDVFAKHVRGSGVEWSQSFLDDGINRVTAIVGSLDNGSTVDVEFSCADPVIDIKLPNNVAKAYTQSSAKVLAQVLVTNGAPDAPVVSGLTAGDFKATINGVPALITTGGFIQEQYWLLIQAPNLPDGVYDLRIALEEPGTSNEIAADTAAASVQYTSNHLDHVIVIDRSGSMQSDGKLAAAKDAANFYVDMTRNDDGLAVVPYHHNVDPAPFPMTDVNAPVRTNAKTYVGGLTASGATSIGDGLNEAVNQRTTSPTANPQCSFVLLSDGMENSALFWDDVEAAVTATHCPVTSIAFGKASDETLMEEIATATGGAFFYNDVFVSGVSAAGADATAAIENTTLDLGDTFEYAQAKSEGRQRLNVETDEIPYYSSEPVTHTVNVDESVHEILFSVNWIGGWQLGMRLVKPDGSVIEPDPYTFYDALYGHMGYRVANPDPGTWQVIVYWVSLPGPDITEAAATQQGGGIPYQMFASGISDLTVELLLPYRVGGDYFTGNRLPIFALVSSNQPVLDATVIAVVTAPNGQESNVPLYDDGLHGDGTAGDGIYGGLYTLVNQAEQVEPAPEEGAQNPPVKDQGAYRVRVHVAKQEIRREVLGSFAVLEGPDTNVNGLPDPWETENGGLVNPEGDPDLDLLLNEDEYLLGTDPHQSDTDGGGENDGSEQRHGQNPLDPADDQIEAPDFFQVEPGNGVVVLSYDVKDEYNRLFAYRASNPGGPWNLQVPELPLTGIYTDTADNNQTYYYKLGAVDEDDHWSAILDSEAVMPKLDPVPPAALVLIDGGAPTTPDLTVELSFVAYEESMEEFEDITEMLLSNDPAFADAQWQPFQQDVAWQLSPTPPGEEARVYARFKDDAGNESVGTEVGSITIAEEAPPENQGIYLPFITK